MNIIKPTPSQAAVALKKFFARQNIDIKLSVAQEAIAVTNGYANWNSLAADIPVRGVKEVGLAPIVDQAPADGSIFPGEDGLQLWAISGRLEGEDDDSLYLLWAKDESQATVLAKMRLCDVMNEFDMPKEGYGEEEQVIYINNTVLVGALDKGRFRLEKAMEPTASTVDLKEKAVTPSPVEVPVAVALPGPTLQEIIEMNEVLQKGGMDDADLRLHRIYYAIQSAAVNSDLFDNWTYQGGRGERCMEGDTPFVQVSFDLAMGRRYATEIVLTLRDKQMAAYVRTWQFHDDEEPMRNYGIVLEESGEFDTDAVVPQASAPLSVLIQNALTEARAHKMRLREELGLD